MQVLLGLVLDIKNNRQRSQGTGGPLTISSVLSAGVLKWLKGCGTDEVQLRNLPWELVLRENKKVLPQLKPRSIVEMLPYVQLLQAACPCCIKIVKLKRTSRGHR